MVATPLAAEAQLTKKVPRVGVLAGQTPEASPPILALRQGLRELGYVEGQNIAIEWRWAHGKNERFADLAAELVQLKVDVIVAATDPAVQAAQKATRTIPVVMAFPTDPLAFGFVDTLARPSGNITGLSAQSSSEITGKRLQLLSGGRPNRRADRHPRRPPRARHPRRPESGEDCRSGVGCAASTRGRAERRRA